MLSTLAVTRSADVADDHHTLRWAVANAHSGDTILITQAVQKTGITLSHGELVLGHDVTIEAKGNAPVKISGGGHSRVFEVARGIQVTLSNLIITGGNGLAANAAGDASKDGVGGGSILQHNSAGEFGGGGIYNGGELMLIDDSHIQENVALVGADVFNDGDLFQDNTSTIGILDGIPAMLI